MYYEILLDTFHASDPLGLLFGAVFLISIFVMLYAMSLMSTKLRLLQEEVENLKSEQNTMSEAMEWMASMKGGQDSLRD